MVAEPDKILTRQTRMKMKTRLKNAWMLLKESFNSFLDDNALKMSASLAYYTIFSLAPMLVIVIAVCGVFFGRDAVQGRVYGQIQGFVGKDAAMQVQEMLKNVEFSGQTPLATVIGVVTLLIGATGIFTEMQDSLNTIWSVKAKPKRGWLKIIINRVLSFSVLVSIGFLLLVSLVISALLNVFSDKLEALLAEVAVVAFYIINNLVIIAVVSALFAVIFKVLPDVRIRWKDVMAGSVFTALLFMAGKFLINTYLSQSDMGSTYGAAGSIIVILVWIYYTSAILYFGAEFTKVYALKFGRGIEPDDDAVRIIKSEVEKEDHRKSATPAKT